MNPRQRKILEFVQHDLGLDERPYLALARGLGISEAQVVRQIRLWQRQGVIRRFGAILDQRKLGLTSNCMCAWQVPRARLGAIGRRCQREPHISHCYARRPAKGWPYNFYTMLHCRSRSACLAFIKRISQECGIEDYRPLFTLRQFKKTSPKYAAK